MRGIGGLPVEDRPRVGVVVNEVRGAVEAAIAEARANAGSAALAARLAAETVDVTAPAGVLARGSLHPILETIDRIAEIFGQFGFVSYEGPEVETDVTNFQMLNIPPDHPARDLWDTMYVDIDGGLLRTHTSPGQIVVMHAEAAADPGAAPGPLLPLRGHRRLPRVGVLPGRGPHGRRGDEPRGPQGPACRVRPRHVRGGDRDPLPARLLPVHGAVGRLRHRLPRVRRVPAVRPAAGPAG